MKEATISGLVGLLLGAHVNTTSLERVNSVYSRGITAVVETEDYLWHPDGQPRIGMFYPIVNVIAIDMKHAPKVEGGVDAVLCHELAHGYFLNWMSPDAHIFWKAMYPEDTNENFAKFMEKHYKLCFK